MTKISVYGLEIDNISEQETLERLYQALENKETTTVVTPNPEIVMRAKKDPDLIALVNRFDFVLPDGVGLIFAAKYRGFPFKERVTGFDISVKLLEYGKQRPIKLFILAGKEGVSKLAAREIGKNFPGVQVVGYHHGYFDSFSESSIVDNIKTSKANLLFVGLGFPRQELFIDKYKDVLGVNVVIANGGTTDILSGQKKRAPKAFIKLNLEWLYRLLQEPKRINRQGILFKFLWQILKDKNAIKAVKK